MNAIIRRILTSNSLSRRLYFSARQTYRISWAERNAGRHFQNSAEFKSALRANGSTELIEIHTADGLRITMRQNFGDAMTIAEIFGEENSYVRYLTLPDHPVVIDIGGFIGDFALYAVKRLNARRVIVCEPSPRNWELLLKNVANNGYKDQIEPVNKAVTAGGAVMMNINAPDECQCTVSAYNQNEEHLTAVSGISLSEILREFAVESVDLLKIDCEGGEFAIFESTPSDVLRRIHNIVFEYHQIDGLWEKLESLKRRLRLEGYTLHTHGGLVTATRN